MTYILNIGLMTGAEKADIIKAHITGKPHIYEGHSPKPIQAFETLTTIDRYARILGHKVIETINDETTLVVWIDKPLDATAALWLSIQLQQIAIAEYDGTQGRLVGPLAPLWGDFDIERFKL